MPKFVRQTIAAACVALMASPAIAEKVTVRVGYADLDLTSPADVAVLEDRLAEALRRACGNDLTPRQAAIRVNEECLERGLENGDKVIAEHKDRALTAVP